MAKIESSFKNMLISLLGITFVASAILGTANELTKGAIEKANVAKQTLAISTVLPQFDKLGDSYKVMPKSGKDSLEIFPALNSEGETIGNAVKTYSNNGFGGDIEIMVGFDAQGTLTGYQVLKHAETPGLGSKMGIWFCDASKDGQNVIGKNPNKVKFSVKKDGGDIDAITAATISSRAFLDAINKAYSAVSESYDGSTSATQQVTE